MSDVFSEMSGSSSSSDLTSSPTRRRPPPLRLTEIGIDPSSIIGKVLKRVSRSSIHPVLTLDFTDNTTFQILVDGYDPMHRGVPKELEMDPLLTELFTQGPSSQMELTIVDCALITLSDKAFQRRQMTSDRAPTNPHDVQQWDQHHLGVAFKFAGENRGTETTRWHCVWATLEEYDEGSCVFRSYDDVYLNKLQRSPRKSKSHMRKPSISS